MSVCHGMPLEVSGHRRGALSRKKKYSIIKAERGKGKWNRKDEMA